MIFQNINSKHNNEKEVIKTWLTGPSCTLVIPRKFALEYGLDKPCHVVLEKMDNGILIRKIEF